MKKEKCKNIIVLFNSEIFALQQHLKAILVMDLQGYSMEWQLVKIGIEQKCKIITETIY